MYEVINKKLALEMKEFKNAVITVFGGELKANGGVHTNFEIR